MFSELNQTRKLDKAIRQWRWQEIGRLISAGVRPSARSLLHVRNHGSQDWQDLLTEAGSPVMFDMTKEERLYSAVLRSNWEQAKELIEEYQAVPDNKVLMVAVHHLDVRWVEMLAQAMAKSGMPLPSKALYHALLVGFQDALFAAGAVPDEEIMCHAARDWSAETLQELLVVGGPATSGVLAAAFGTGDPKLSKVRMLLKAGAVPDEETIVNAITYCEAGWGDMLLEAFVEAGRKPTTAMLKAAYAANKKDIVKTLTAHGVVADADTLMTAVKAQRPEWSDGQCAEFLLKELKTRKAEPITPAYNEAAATEKPAETPKLKLKLRQPTRPLYNLRNPE